MLVEMAVTVVAEPHSVISGVNFLFPFGSICRNKKVTKKHGGVSAFCMHLLINPTLPALHRVPLPSVRNSTLKLALVRLVGWDAPVPD